MDTSHAGSGFSAFDVVMALLIVFGSIVAFSSYIWLLKQTAPSLVSTHAYINPVVAMILGWALADEALTSRNILAAIIIIISVAIITTYPVEKIAHKK